MEEKGSQRQDHEARTEDKLGGHMEQGCVRWSEGGTYIDIAFDVSNKDEVTGPGVADIGINGDGPSRVPLNKVG